MYHHASPAQQEALKEIYNRDRSVAPSFSHFKRSSYYAPTLDVLFVPWKGITLGIEKDGYVHS